MNTVILLPDGVGIRNFLCTKFVQLLAERGNVFIWHGLSDESIAPFVEQFGQQVLWERMAAHHEGLWERVFRQAKLNAQLRWRAEASQVRNRSFKTHKMRLTSRLIAASAELIARISATPAGVSRLHRIHEKASLKSNVANHYMQRLKSTKADVIFCSHQRASLAVPAMAAARRVKVPAVTFIYSWDNIPKGRMAVHADDYLVWSDWMREEMAAYYPDVPPERVHVVGTPQFEHYFNNQLLLSRKDFLQGLGLDARKSTVCFSGDDVTTSPHDPQYLADTATAIRKIPADRRPQLLFRRCPTDLSNRFREVLHQFPEICVLDPLWKATTSGNWTQVVPTRGDLGLLANIVLHSDLMVNLGSTMALDIAVFDKPSIYLAYDPVGRARKVPSVYSLPHFHWVHKLQPVYWARSDSQLTDLILHALEHPHEKRDARRAWLTKIVEHPLCEASRRCVDQLEAIAYTRKTHAGGIPDS